mgnify:CR=1 FL=1
MPFGKKLSEWKAYLTHSLKNNDMVKVIIFNEKFNLQVIRNIDQKRKVYRCYSDGLHNFIGRADFKVL